MRVVILAGGMGSRLDIETELKPKPMIEIGGRPILWHIMKHLSHYGLNEFILALGYRGDVIKRYFSDFANLAGNMEVDLTEGTVCTRHEPPAEGWKIHLVDTGHTANTAWRLLSLKPMLTERFLVTYGDGLIDLDMRERLWRHENKVATSLCTLTAVRPPARYGSLLLNGARVERFTEKSDEGWINGGYMVFEPEIFGHRSMLAAKPQTDLSSGILAELAFDDQLEAHRHEGFWQCMDTMRDKRILEQLWTSGKAPWKVWT
jgi:glucose-1-phosphate cytidylyltransferase